MLGQITHAVKYVLGLDQAGRDFQIYPDDTFVVSYPKSGNTWTRFLIANLLNSNEHADFSNINRLVPDPEALSKRAMKKLARPRVLKSHWSFEPRFKKVVYIVRDPRDVVLSQYHFQVKRRAIKEGEPIDDQIRRFVAGETSPYGSWGENVGSWVAARSGNPLFLLVRYEDLESDGIQELERIAAFLGVPADRDRLATVVERSSADEMRKLEKAQGHLWSTTKDTRQDKAFVRAAKSGGWRKELPERCAAQIESAWGPLMSRLNYELLSHKPVEAGVNAVGMAGW